MTMDAPASSAFVPRSIRSPTSLRLSAASSATVESPPEPNWTPVTGHARELPGYRIVSEPNTLRH